MSTSFKVRVGTKFVGRYSFNSELTLVTAGDASAYDTADLAALVARSFPGAVVEEYTFDLVKFRPVFVREVRS